MRKSRIVLLLISVFVLSGCDKDFATLIFAESVYPDLGGKGYKLVYREQLDLLLHKQGIDPAQVSMRTEANGRELILETPLFGGLEPPQMALLQQALQKIIDQRDQGLKVEFTLRPDDLVSDKPEYHQQAAGLPLRYPVNLKVSKPLIGLSYGFRNKLYAIAQGTENEKRTQEMSCYIAFTVEPALTFYGLDNERSESGEITGSYLTKTYRSSYTRYDIPVDIQVQEPRIQRHLDEKKIFFSTQLTHGRYRINRKGITELELYIGSMGEVEHVNGQVNYLKHRKLKKQCQEMAVSFGRPFTYTMGESLDRLQKISFY